MASSAQSVVEQVARESYGQLLASLAVRTRDLAGAEDALSDALLEALRLWPERGIPDNPAGWLLQTAKRRLIDGFRRRETRERAQETLREDLERSLTEIDPDHMPDKRLELLFVCAHPAIDPAARTPLCLQVVMGIPTERIASAFLTAPSAMQQRLVRAKAKIRDAGIPFHIPDRIDWPERLPCVLDAIYASFNAGWEDLETGPNDLAQEAIFLARLLVSLVPEEPEAHGLLALLLYCEARREARRTSEGAFVPLTEQDTTLWNSDHIAEAEQHLQMASVHQQLGRYQLNAAIQSVHSQRRHTGSIHWPAIVELYRLLLQHHPTTGALIAQAAALGEMGDPLRGLEILDQLPTKAIQDHQPYWATRAHLLSKAEREEESHQAFTRAIGLASDPAIRKWLQLRRDQG